jgi:MraZ protein
VFTGQYEYSVDDRGRAPVPPRYRADFKGGLFLSKGLDTCLNAYTPEDWQRLSEAVTARSFTDPDARDLRRNMASWAFELEVDKQGRILLPPPLRQYAGIGQNVVIVGVFDSLEIWSAERWAEKANHLLTNPPQINNAAH